MTKPLWTDMSKRRNFDCIQRILWYFLTNVQYFKSLNHTPRFADVLTTKLDRPPIKIDLMISEQLKRMPQKAKRSEAKSVRRISGVPSRAACETQDMSESDYSN